MAADVALVFPRFKYPSGDIPLGVSYLAAVLEKEGVKVDVYDTTFSRRSPEAIAKTISSKRYKIVGFSCMTTMMRDALTIAGVVKMAHPSTKIIFGGPHPTMMPEDTLSFHQVDAVCIGEGEHVFTEAAKKQGDLSSISGMWYKEKGRIIRNSPRKPCDIDSLPHPSTSQLDMKRYLWSWFQLDSVNPYLKGINIIASRGCPFSCTYCQPTLDTLFGKKLRFRNPENVAEEISSYKRRYDVDAVMFVDDTLLCSKAWLKDLCKRLSNLDIVWGCNVRADQVDRESLEMMMQAGLRKIFIGIESANQRILDEIYQKGIDITQVESAVATAKSLGLKVQGYFMLGAPTETSEEVKNTIRFAKKLDIDEATFSITSPLPGTELYTKNTGNLSGDMLDIDYYKRPIFKKGQIDARRLDSLKVKAYLSFYLSSRRIKYTLSSLLSLGSVRKSLLKLQRFR